MATLSLNKLKKRSPPGISVKTKKKVNRFDGQSEEEIQKYTLPDYLEMNLDVVIVGINPSLMAAHRGRYYAGPGNHFYKLLHESGLTPRFISYEEDYKLPQYGIGLTNIVDRPTRSSADIKRTEMKEGSKRVSEKLLHYKPKIAVFNGKCIYEAYVPNLNKSTFRFGLQPELIGETAAWVVPSSSARCANYPRMVDKLHFYTALRKYLLLLKGEITDVDVKDFFFDGKCGYAIPSTSKMWRRKNMSAFLHGGRVANKDTVCLDTSDENIASVRSTEFIVHLTQSTLNSDSTDDNITKEQESQEIVIEDSLQETKNEDRPVIAYEDSRKMNEEGEKRGSTKSRLKNVYNEDNAPKKKRRSKKPCAKTDEKDITNSQKPKHRSRKITKRTSPKTIRVSTVRQNTNSLDFVNLIKQRIIEKTDHSDNVKSMEFSVARSKCSVNKPYSLVRTNLPESTKKNIDEHD